MKPEKGNQNAMQRQLALLLVLAVSALGALACASGGTGTVRVSEKDAYTLVPDKNPIDAFPAINLDGTINVVVEIPAGTNQKWELTKQGVFKWEFTGDKPREIAYLPYPGNYGLVPRTLLDEAGGGDGAPLDVMVLGPAVERGKLVKAHPIGVIKLLDRGEQDDKILAVMDGTPLSKATDAEDLEAKFPGSTQILRIWFSNYVGDSMLFLGLGSRASAISTVEIAAESYKQAN